MQGLVQSLTGVPFTTSHRSNPQIQHCSSPRSGVTQGAARAVGQPACVHQMNHVSQSTQPFLLCFLSPQWNQACAVITAHERHARVVHVPCAIPASTTSRLRWFGAERLRLLGLGPQLPAIAVLLQAVPGVAELVQPELAEVVYATFAAGELAVAVAVGELQRSTFRYQQDIQCSSLSMAQIEVVHMYHTSYSVVS
jgi:hypothetical protein